MTRESKWSLVTSVPMSFRTHHPQGLVKIRDRFILSSVEKRVPTKPPAPTAEGYDRDTGEGVGHLFEIDSAGRLLTDLRIGEASIYHPGGIDYDGTHVWVPVAEYRPNSRSIVYRVDPRTMKATEVFRFANHIGAIVHDTEDRTLHGVSWGSRRFHRWKLDEEGRVTDADASPEALRTLNTSHYLDYQDCKFAGHRRMVTVGAMWVDSRESRESTAIKETGIELEAAGRFVTISPS